jgi:hypothetical protein
LSAFEDGEDLESTNEKSCGSCIQVIVKSWHWEERGSPSYVCDHMHQ